KTRRQCSCRGLSNADKWTPVRSSRAKLSRRASYSRRSASGSRASKGYLFDSLGKLLREPPRPLIGIRSNLVGQRHSLIPGQEHRNLWHFAKATVGPLHKHQTATPIWAA